MVTEQTIYDRDNAPVAQGSAVDDVAIYQEEDILWIGDTYIRASRRQLAALRELLDSLVEEETA